MSEYSICDLDEITPVFHTKRSQITEERNTIGTRIKFMKTDEPKFEESNQIKIEEDPKNSQNKLRFINVVQNERPMYYISIKKHKQVYIRVNSDLNMASLLDSKQFFSNISSNQRKNHFDANFVNTIIKKTKDCLTAVCFFAQIGLNVKTNKIIESKGFLEDLLNRFKIGKDNLEFSEDIKRAAFHSWTKLGFSSDDFIEFFDINRKYVLTNFEDICHVHNLLVILKSQILIYFVIDQQIQSIRLGDQKSNNLLYAITYQLDENNKTAELLLLDNSVFLVDPIDKVKFSYRPQLLLFPHQTMFLQQFAKEKLNNHKNKFNYPNFLRLSKKSKIISEMKQVQELKFKVFFTGQCPLIAQINIETKKIKNVAQSFHSFRNIYTAIGEEKRTIQNYNDKKVKSKNDYALIRQLLFDQMQNSSYIPDIDIESSYVADYLTPQSLNYFYDHIKENPLDIKKNHIWSFGKDNDESDIEIKQRVYSLFFIDQNGMLYQRPLFKLRSSMKIKSVYCENYQNIYVIAIFPIGENEHKVLVLQGDIGNQSLDDMYCCCSLTVNKIIDCTFIPKEFSNGIGVSASLLFNIGKETKFVIYQQLNNKLYSQWTMKETNFEPFAESKAQISYGPRPGNINIVYENQKYTYNNCQNAFQKRSEDKILSLISGTKQWSLLDKVDEKFTIKIPSKSESVQFNLPNDTKIAGVHCLGHDENPFISFIYANNNESTIYINSHNFKLSIDKPADGNYLALSSELSSKLFLVLEDGSFYHPAKRNLSMDASIISCFYRIIRHFPRNIFKSININNDKFLSYQVCCIIDIGYEGPSLIKTRLRETSSPHIFYQVLSDNSSIYQFDLIFANGLLPIGLDHYRTQCQLIAAFCCSHLICIKGCESLYKGLITNDPKCTDIAVQDIVATYATLLENEPKDLMTVIQILETTRNFVNEIKELLSDFDSYILKSIAT